MPTQLGFGLQPTEATIKRGRRVSYSQAFDDTMSRMLQTPTPNACKAVWDRIDRGEYHELVRLAIEMERRDSQIRHCAESRRMSLRAVDWEILPNAETKDEAAAQDAADYCNEHLRKLSNFRFCINHLVTALTDGIAAVELMWENSELVGLDVVPYTRLMGQPFGGTQIFVQTDAEPLGEPMPWRKFIVRSTCYRPPHPIGVSVVHAASKIFCIKCVAQQDWTTFMDVYGVPARLYKPGALLEGDALIAAEEAMKQLSSDFWAILNGATKESEVVSFTPGTSSDVFEKAIAWCDDSLSKLYLMQTLTSDVRDSGSRSLGEVHQNTRADLLADDMMAESDDIEFGLLKPMVEMKFPGRDMPTPWWRRKLIEQKNIEAERLELEQLRFASERGLHIDDDVLYEKLNIPIPTTEKADTKTDQDVAVTVNELTLGIERAVRAGDLALVNALRTKISEHLGVELPPMPSLPTPSTDQFGRPIDKNNDEENGNDEDDDSQADDANDKVAATIREQVMQAIERSWLSTKDIMQLTKLSEGKVKGVLTDRYLRTKIRKRKQAGKSTEYRRAT